jgi:hypothetical protein
MEMIFEPFFIFILVLIGILLFAFAFKLFSAPGVKKTQNRQFAKGHAGSAGACPVCLTILQPGEQLKTVLYPGNGERICHIFGCPHCYPIAEDGAVRICPVCKKRLPPEKHLIARMFEHPGKKNHVHILGCTECRIRSKP